MSLISKHASKLVVSAFLLFWLLWQGIPAFNRWQADKLVDELCAKDGIKVYETVKLPKYQFDKWGNAIVRGKSFMEPSDEYFYEDESQVYEKNKNPEWVEHHRDQQIEIRRTHYKFYRKLDNKLLGESMSYYRTGGEAIGPWGLLSYTCSIGSSDELNKQIFLKVE